MSVTRRTIGGLAGAVLVVLAGCSAPAAEPTGLATGTTASATPTPTVSTSPTVDAEGAVIDAWGRWWVAAVAAERGNPDPTLFDGVGTGVARENEMARARYYAENSIVRAGEPVFSDVVAQVDGDGAVVAACMDASDWRPEDAPVFAPGLSPIQLRFELTDGAWLVAEYVEATVELPC